jgi:hypothetical protein
MSTSASVAHRENTISLRGKILSLRQETYQGQRVVRHVVRLPISGDEFARPSSVEVRHTEKLGSVGAEVSAVCTWEGGAREFKFTKDGEDRTGLECKGAFVVVG